MFSKYRRVLFQRSKKAVLPLLLLLELKENAHPLHSAHWCTTNAPNLMVKSKK
jgi:hypothetical protein